MADQIFSKGSKVEVSSDEEGFKGAWYLVTVIDWKGHNFLVEYDELLEDEEKSERLKEWVHVSFIRPLPPVDVGVDFEVNDMVEASYRDGWWIGVVTRFVDRGDDKRVVVSFENPPEECEFDRSEIRLHREWTDGKWDKPQTKSMDMVFTKGTAVEVSFPNKKLSNGWYVGTILQVSGNKNLLVEYQCAGVRHKLEHRKANVDFLHIRPSPPRLEEKDFLLLDEVEAYYDYCWWSGVINELLENGRYIVHFSHTKKEKEFNFSELRPRMDWTDGKWIIASQEIKEVPKLHSQAAKWNRQKRRAKKQRVIRPCSSSTGKKGKAREISVEEIVEKECITDVDMCVKEVKGTLSENPCETLDKAPLKNDQNQQVNLDMQPITDEINESNDRESNQMKKRGRPQKSFAKKEIGVASNKAEGAPTELVVKDCIINDVETNDGKRTDYQFELSDNISLKKLFTDDMKRLSGLHTHNDLLTSIREARPSENDKKVSKKRSKRLKKSLSVVDIESKTQDFQEPSNGKACESNEMHTEKNEVEILDHEMSCDEDQPLLTWSKDKQATTIMDYSKASPVKSLDQWADAIAGANENELPLSAIDTNDRVKSFPLPKTTTNDSDCGVLPAGNLNQFAEDGDKEDEHGTSAIVNSDSVDNNQNLPFLKCSPVWKSFDSMEIFHKTPQKPHFSPLLSCDEDDREGLAIFHMVKFSTVAEKTLKLRVSDPTSIIEKNLRTLADFEVHGFDVEEVRVYLNELLLKKEREHELQEQSKKVENEIGKINLEKTEFEKEMNEIDMEMGKNLVKMRELGEMMKELGDKHAAARSTKEVKDKEISRLQSKLEEIQENVRAIHL